jgi:arginyl-tRNA--protein-N-Asp/Glu arginylyltransferase
MATMNLTLTIPAQHAQAILNDFCEYHGYQEQVEVDGEMVANPQTKPQFAKAKVASFVKESVKAYRANKQAEEARQAEIDLVEAIDIK